MPLTDAKCRSAQPGPKLQKLTDGGGLQLWLQPTGARLWRFAYRFDGKQKLLAIGIYPMVPLARARQAREDAKRLLAEGLDPALEKKRQAQVRSDAPTFRGIADEYVAKLRREKRSEATMAKVEWLLGFANAEFGEKTNRSGLGARYLECCGPLKPARDTNPLACFDQRSEAYSDTLSPPRERKSTRLTVCGVR